jgi:hypothetical protein
VIALVYLARPCRQPLSNLRRRLLKHLQIRDIWVSVLVGSPFSTYSFAAHARHLLPARYLGCGGGSGGGAVDGTEGGLLTRGPTVGRS